MIRSKFGQRMAGLFLTALAAGFTAWVWHTALNEGYYYRKAAALFPAFVVIGLGLLLFPIDMEEVKKKYGVEKPERMEHYPLLWKLLVPVAVAAGLGNWFAISQLGE